MQDSAGLRLDIIRLSESSRKEILQQMDVKAAALKNDTETFIRAGLQASCDEQRIGLSSLESKVTTAADATSEQLDTVIKHVSSMVDDFKSLERKMQDVVNTLTARPPSGSGEPGFLGQHCPAPPGWNQREYEAQLKLAAWTYIFEHGGQPEDGFGADWNILRDTKIKFPDLREEDITVTLRHLHMRVHHCPMIEEKDDPILMELADLGVNMNGEGENAVIG